MADDVFRDWAVRATLGDTRNEVVGPDDPPEIYNAGEDQARVFYR